MLVRHSYRIEVAYKEILRKGTIAILTTLVAGLLFQKKNMMIAFVLVLGSNVLSLQNFRIKLLEKTVQLILFDEIIVCLSYVAALNRWWGLGVNLLAIFDIIYLTTSPYDPLSYKTFMMLFVFCQYTKVTLMELPVRMIMVVYAVSIVVFTNYWQQRRNRSLLPAGIKKAFQLLETQLIQMLSSGYEEKLYDLVNQEMRTLAYVIYRTSYRRYFTTYLGRVQFHFYLNVSYLNVLISQLAVHYKKGYVERSQVEKLKMLLGEVNSYFEKEIRRGKLIARLESYLTAHEKDEGIMGEFYEVIYSLKKNFEELENLDHKKDHKIYSSWSRSDLSRLQTQLREHFSPKSMSFNFALRMAVILTVSLFLAEILGYYKIIWAVIPIMSIAQPYYEDTRSRRNDRVESNLWAAAVLTVMLNIIEVRWLSYLLIFAAFYLIFAYKDYYHYSFFITVISMGISSLDMGITTLFIYRVIYVLLGALIVTISAKIFPYRLDDGIQDLITEAEHLNDLLERESVICMEGQGNHNLIREALIRSAMLCEKLQAQNKAYRSQRIEELIALNTEFTIRLGHRVLRDSDEHEKK